MKNFILLFLVFNVTHISFSQETNMSYYFNYMTTSNDKDYSINFIGKTIFITNQNDATYNLLIRANGIINEATITDYKNKLIIKFDLNFNFEKIEDLNKLSNSKLYTVVEFSKSRIYKDFVEDFEFEKDTINSNTIVHLTQFKNKKRKKIINENFYFFGNNNNVETSNKNSIKNYISNRYNLKFNDNENIEKILHLHDGKIARETNIVAINFIDFKFDFKIDKIYPKTYNF